MHPESKRVQRHFRSDLACSLGIRCLVGRKPSASGRPVNCGCLRLRNVSVLYNHTGGITVSRNIVHSCIVYLKRLHSFHALLYIILKMTRSGDLIVMLCVLNFSLLRKEVKSRFKTSVPVFLKDRFPCLTANYFPGNLDPESCKSSIYFNFLVAFKIIKIKISYDVFKQIKLRQK